MPEHGTSATRTASLQSLYTHGAVPKYSMVTFRPSSPHRWLRLVGVLRQNMMSSVARHEKACISMHVSVAAAPAAHWNLKLKLARSFSQPWILRMEARYAKLIRVVAILCFFCLMNPGDSSVIKIRYALTMEYKRCWCPASAEEVTTLSIFLPTRCLSHSKLSSL